MTDRAFIDTNVCVYAVDTADPAKQARALEVLAAGPDKDYVVSVQVLGEFYATVTGELTSAISSAEARALVEQMKQLPVVPIDVALVNEAFDGHAEWQVSYWVALILVAAAAAKLPRSPVGGPRRWSPLWLSRGCEPVSGPRPGRAGESHMMNG